MEQNDFETLDEIFPNDNSDEVTFENEISEEDLERMTKWRLQEEEKEKQLHDLIILYRYDSSFKFIESSYSFFSSMINSVIGKFKKSNKLQLAELISLLSSCRDNKITISGIVSHPKKGEIKSQIKKVELSSPLDIHNFSLWANTVLENAQDGYYQYLFNWEFKENIKYLLSNKEVVYDEFYIEPYTDDELDKILAYERTEKKKEKNYTRNAEYGRCLTSFYNTLHRLGVFTAQIEKEKSGKASGITKEYCFMYDCLVLLDATEPLDDNKEKYTKVKDWINAFATQKSK